MSNKTDDGVIENFQSSEIEKPMSQVTLQELEGVIGKVYQLQDEADVLESQLSEKSKQLNHLKGKLLAIFQEFNKQNYRSHRGLIVRQKRFTVTHPKEPTRRAAFFDFLKEKGVFEDMVSVHSQTLNSFYKAEMEAAVAAGQTDFVIPGLDEPKYVETLALRRK